MVELYKAITSTGACTDAHTPLKFLNCLGFTSDNEKSGGVPAGME